jgi:hypothetical protein
LGQGEGRWRRGGREGPAGRRARVRVGGQTRGHDVLEREPDGESKMQWMKISGPNCGKSKEPSPAASEPSAPWDPAFSFGGRRAGSARDARGSNARLRAGSALARAPHPHLRWYVSPQRARKTRACEQTRATFKNFDFIFTVEENAGCGMLRHPRKQKYGIVQ